MPCGHSCLRSSAKTGAANAKRCDAPAEAGVRPPRTQGRARCLARLTENAHGRRGEPKHAHE
eukprot:10750858-Lingulodinium_polyedra.AAC.1